MISLCPSCSTKLRLLEGGRDGLVCTNVGCVDHGSLWDDHGNRQGTALYAALEPAERRHPTVGYRFKSGGALYACTSWDRSCGFWMEMVGGKSALLPDRKVGQRFNVSERAIGRTYHRESYSLDTPYQPVHDEGCNCFICEGREP